MRRMQRPLFTNKSAAVGIGGLIVFIALVLVAGISASVIIDTSGSLESQTMATGKETTAEVGTGIDVYSVEAFADNASDISRLAILIRITAGSNEINMNDAFFEFADSSKKVVLNYSNSYYSAPDGFNDLFTAPVFPDNTTNQATQFGILVLRDVDSSLSSASPIINRGDQIYICINVTASLGDIAENKEVRGKIVPEVGYSGVVRFRTPTTFADNVMEVQLDL